MQKYQTNCAVIAEKNAAKEKIINTGTPPDAVVIHVSKKGGTNNVFSGHVQDMNISTQHTGDIIGTAEKLAEKVYGAGKYDLQRYGNANTWIAKPIAKEEKPQEIETRIEKTTAGEQITPTELRPQAEMPKGKITRESLPVEGRGAPGVFDTEAQKPKPKPVDMFAEEGKEMEKYQTN